MGAEILTLLNAKTARLDGAGGGGLPTLTASDVAGALGMAEFRSKYVKNIAIHLAYVKFAGMDDYATVRDLKLHIWHYLREISLAQGWDIPDGSEIREDMAEAAVYAVTDAQRCLCCRGTGVTRQQRVCVRCNGSGLRRPKSGRKLAEEFKVPETTFRRVWLPRFNTLVIDLQGFLNDVELVLWRQLQDVPDLVD